jgi:hypothetical protein
MATGFLDQLNELTEKAKATIYQLIQKDKEITIFEAIDYEDDVWTKDIYDKVPDFAFYDKAGFVEYAAIKEIRFADDTINVTGVFKGENYPKTITIRLNEMDCQNIIALADYLLSDNK